MVRYRNARGQPVFSTINITPFTDVILVLLIVFMISAPGLVSTALDISLPEAASGESRPASTLLVGISRDGELWFRERLIDHDTLKEEILRAVEENPAVSVAVHADRETRHEAVIEVLDQIRQAGAKNLVVGTLRPSRAADR